MAEERER